MSIILPSISAIIRASIRSLIPTSGAPTLASISDTAEADWSASDSRSYAGSGTTWTDMIGEKTLTLVNPVFNDNSLSFGGTGYAHNNSAALPPTLQNVTNTGTAGTLCMAWKNAGNYDVFTQAQSSGAGVVGLRMLPISTNARVYEYSNDTFTFGNTIDNPIDTTGWNFAAITWTAGGSVVITTNGGAKRTTNTITEDANDSTTLVLGARADLTNPAPAGFEIAEFGVYNSVLSDADILAVKALYETRVGVSFPT